MINRGADLRLARKGVDMGMPIELTVLCLQLAQAVFTEQAGLQLACGVQYPGLLC